jgi:hypothetical protein
MGARTSEWRGLLLNGISYRQFRRGLPLDLSKVKSHLWDFPISSPSGASPRHFALPNRIRCVLRAC